MNSKFSPALGPLLFTLLAAVALWLYWPGHTGPLLLDDRAVLTPLSELAENEALASDFVFRERSGKLGRAVSMATFVLEKRYLGDSLEITKQLNILLHLLNGALVYWLLLLLFRYLQTPSSNALALLLAGVWMLSPLYVSTVLYAVQRMAMLSTTFMLGACIAYAYWRETVIADRARHSLLLLVAAMILLGVFSKENGLLAVPVILLLEALWYQFRGSRGQALPWLKYGCLGLIALGAAGLLLLLLLKYDYLSGRFQHRPFTLEERLLTQTRILWDYVAQFFWPQPGRMGIYHDDVVISRSLSAPASTLYALLGWVAALLVAVLALFKRGGRYLLLGPLLFLAGHSLESTVFSLELYFEHRNYFPGLGLVLALGVLYRVLVGRWQELRRPLLAYLLVYCAWLGLMTSAQVQIWSSRPLLSFSHINGHPQSYRANTEMAVLMATLGDIDLAREYSRRGFEASYHERSADQLVRELTLYCITDQPADPDMLAQLGSADPRRPFRSPSGLLLLVRLLQAGDCPDFGHQAFADRMEQIFLAPAAVATAHKSVYYALAVLENSLQRYDRAYLYSEKFLKKSPWNSNVLLMKLHFSTALGRAGERADAIAQLQQLERQGKLSIREQQTLALYLEN